MQDSIDNMQKYENYRIQMGRLKKAFAYEFYLEAIFIEYAVMEDRLESILRHGGKWNVKPDEHISIYKKIKKVEKMAEQKRSLPSKYFSGSLLDDINEWKEERNRVIHALLKQDMDTKELKEIAERGQSLVKELSNKASLYKKAVERQK